MQVIFQDFSPQTYITYSLFPSSRAEIFLKISSCLYTTNERASVLPTVAYNDQEVDSIHFRGANESLCPFIESSSFLPDALPAGRTQTVNHMNQELSTQLTRGCGCPWRLGDQGRQSNNHYRCRTRTTRLVGTRTKNNTSVGCISPSTWNARMKKVVLDPMTLAGRLAGSMIGLSEGVGGVSESSLAACHFLDKFYQPSPHDAVKLQRLSNATRTYREYRGRGVRFRGRVLRTMG